MLVDPAAPAKGPAFDHARLATAISTAAASGTTYTATTLPFSTFTFVDNMQAIEFAIGGGGGGTRARWRRRRRPRWRRAGRQARLPRAALPLHADRLHVRATAAARRLDRRRGDRAGARRRARRGAGAGAAPQPISRRRGRRPTASGKRSSRTTTSTSDLSRQRRANGWRTPSWWRRGRWRRRRSRRRRGESGDPAVVRWVRGQRVRARRRAAAVAAVAAARRPAPRPAAR